MSLQSTKPKLSDVEYIHHGHNTETRKYAGTTAGQIWWECHSCAIGARLVEEDA
jgi:hypothetical protein